MRARARALSGGYWDRLQHLERGLACGSAHGDTGLLSTGSRAHHRRLGIRFCTALVPHRGCAASAPIPFLVAAFVLFGYGAVIYNITQISFRQAVCPERMQGRMNSVMRFIVWGVMPIGSLLGGALATWIGLRETMWIGAAIGLFAFVPILLSPVRTLREMPEPDAAEPAGA